MDISITNVQLDLGAGRRGTDMGPSAIHVAGLVPRLRTLGHTVVDVVSFGAESSFENADAGDPHARFLPQIHEVCTRIADRVEADALAGRFPLVFGGDSRTGDRHRVGARAGVARGERAAIGLLWVDAHTDMNTPDTTQSGNIHGMPLAALLGLRPERSRRHRRRRAGACAPNTSRSSACATSIGRRPAVVHDAHVRVYTMSELDERGTAVCVREAIEHVSKGTVGVHLSFDLDGVGPPGRARSSARRSRGPHGARVAPRVRGRGPQRRLLGMEMVELNPTARLPQQDRRARGVADPERPRQDHLSKRQRCHTVAAALGPPPRRPHLTQVPRRPRVASYWRG
jgi:arginase